jgi:very-short-patch-repair endonuclease
MLPSLPAIMASLGGVAHIQDLLECGYTRHQVAAMSRQGELIRARIGWYVSPMLESDAIRAIRVGGRLGCISAARSHGLAVPIDHRLHIALDEHATRLRSSRTGFRNISAGDDPGVVRHWSGQLGTEGTERFRLSVVSALEQVASCAQSEWAVGVLDSALNKGLIDTEGRERLEANPSTRRLLGLTDARAESILESILRVRLRAAGINVRSQVPIGRYRADFLVDGWLIIEADGALHGTEMQFASDRERDSFFVGNGFPVLRFTYRQIVDQWPQTLRAISAALNQRVFHA